MIENLMGQQVKNNVPKDRSFVGEVVRREATRSVVSFEIFELANVGVETDL